MKPGADPTDGKRFGGVLRGRLDLVGGSVRGPAERPARRAGRPRRRREHPRRPARLRASESRRGDRRRVAPSRRPWASTARGVGVAVIDSGVTRWHDDLTDLNAVGQAARPRRPARRRLRRLRERRACGLRRQRPRHARRRDHRRQRLRHRRRPRRHRAGARTWSASRCWTTTGRARSATSSPRCSGPSPTAASTTSASSTSRSARPSPSRTLTDPLTLAAKRAVDAGIVVVAAAGNFGRNDAGETQYGGITAPGNAPWVLTVGASNIAGTAERGDDTVAPTARAARPRSTSRPSRTSSRPAPASCR